MRFIGRRSDPVPRTPHPAHGLGRGADSGQREDHAVRGLQLRRPGGDRRCGAKASPGDEGDFRALLYAPDMHDPDLIIRTSGEHRISNYLLWQGAYSECVFRDELWPDFSRESFEQSLEEFAARSRRFGAVADASGARARRAPRRATPRAAPATREAREPAGRREARAAPRKSRAGAGSDLADPRRGPGGGHHDRLRRPRRARVRRALDRRSAASACTSSTGCSSAGGRSRWSGSPPLAGDGARRTIRRARATCSRSRWRAVPVAFLA